MNVREEYSKVLHGVVEKDDSVGRKLVSNLDSYLKFVALYKKNRPIDLQNLIKEIVEKEDSIVTRIQKIEQLDIAYEEGISVSELGYEAVSLGVVGKGDAESKDTKTKKIKDAKSKEKKKKLVANTFLNYVLFSRPRLIQFGERTKTISFDFFGLKKRESGEALLLWSEFSRYVKESVQKEVHYVVLNGWKELNPLSYNVVVTFYEFVSLFARLGGLIKRGNTVYRNLRIIDLFVKPYLKVLSRGSYREGLKTTLYKLLENHSQYGKTVSKTVSTVEKMVNIDMRDLSFCNAILAEYGLYYNRFVNLSELYEHYDIGKIEEDKFIFDDIVKHRVSRFIEEVDEALEELEGELFFLQNISVSSDIKVKEGLYSEPGKGWIELFNRIANYEYHVQIKSQSYGKTYGKSRAYNVNPFNSFYRDVAGVMRQLSKGFIAHYGDFIRGQVYVGGEDAKKSIIVFSKTFLRYDINQLEELSFKRIGIGSIGPLSLDKYLLYTASQALPNEEEENECRIVESMVLIYKSIGYKLSRILYLHDISSGLRGEELLKAYKTKDEAIEYTDDGQGRLIPYANEKIILHPLLSDKSVIEVIKDIVSFTLNLIYFLREDDISRRYRAKDSIISHMDHYISLKARVEQ